MLQKRRRTNGSGKKGIVEWWCEERGWEPMHRLGRGVALDRSRQFICRSRTIGKVYEYKCFQVGTCGSGRPWKFLDGFLYLHELGCKVVSWEQGWEQAVENLCSWEHFPLVDMHCTWYFCLNIWKYPMHILLPKQCYSSLVRINLETTEYK